MVDYRERLGLAMKARKLTASGLAKEVGVSYQAVKKVVDGNSRAFSAENNARAAKVLQVSSDWLALGVGEAQRKDDASLSDTTVLVPSLAPTDSSQEPSGEAADLGLLASALPLSRDWALQLLRPTSVDALRYLYARGDSMQDTFHDGDLLLVDIGTNAIGADGIYVLLRHERLQVKRVTLRSDGSYDISSDNPGVKTVDVIRPKMPLQVLGRVLWVFVGKKL